LRGNTISCKPNLKLHAKSVTKFKPYTAKSERAYLDWYFCDPESESYPIRNVSKLGKLEPHYEDLTFNACASCNQMMLNSAERFQSYHRSILLFLNILEILQKSISRNILFPSSIFYILPHLKE